MNQLVTPCKSISFRKTFAIQALAICLTVFVIPGATVSEASQWSCNLLLSRVYDRNTFGKNIFGWLWGTPNKNWENKTLFREIDGKLHVALSQTDQTQWHEVVRFNERGNPIIKVNSRTIRFVPTQPRVEKFHQYAKNEGSQDITKITKKRPVRASYYNGYNPSHPTPEVIVFGGEPTQGAPRWRDCRRRLLPAAPYGSKDVKRKGRISKRPVGKSNNSIGLDAIQRFSLKDSGHWSK